MTEKKMTYEETWAKRRFPRKMRSVLVAIGRAAYRIKEYLDIRMAYQEPKEVLLANLVAKELKRLGFGVYCRKAGPKNRKYRVIWGKNLGETPEGFTPVE